MQTESIDNVFLRCFVPQAQQSQSPALIRNPIDMLCFHYYNVYRLFGYQYATFLKQGGNSIIGWADV